MSKQRRIQENEMASERDADIQALLDAEEALRRPEVSDLEMLERAAAAALRLHKRAHQAREAMKDALAKQRPAVKILQDFTVPGRFKVYAGKVYTKAEEPNQYSAIVRAGKVGDTIEFVPAP